MTEPAKTDDVTVLAVETLTRGFLRVNRYHLRHRLFAGGMSEPFIREMLERSPAVGVLPYDPVTDEIVLIEQFRPGAYLAGVHPWMIECVAGIIDDGSSPEAVAAREAEEEAGLTLLDLEPIATYLPTQGQSTERVFLFVGRVDARQRADFAGLAHENEDIRVFTVPAEEAIAMADAGRIEGSATLIALMWFARHHTDLKARWEGRPVP